MIELLYASQLFGIRAGKLVIVTDNARACANSLRIAIVKLKIPPQAIREVNVRVAAENEEPQILFLTSIMT